MARGAGVDVIETNLRARRPRSLCALPLLQLLTVSVAAELYSFVAVRLAADSSSASPRVSSRRGCDVAAE